MTDVAAQMDDGKLLHAHTVVTQNAQSHKVVKSGCLAL